MTNYGSFAPHPIPPTACSQRAHATHLPPFVPRPHCQACPACFSLHGVYHLLIPSHSHCLPSFTTTSPTIITNGSGLGHCWLVPWPVGLPLTQWTGYYTHLPLPPHYPTTYTHHTHGCTYTHFTHMDYLPTQGMGPCHPCHSRCLASPGKDNLPAAFHPACQEDGRSLFWHHGIGWKKTLP